MNSVAGGEVAEVPSALRDVPHPFPYQGSKRALAPTLLRMFPEGVRRLVEPFAGSAALSIHARYSGMVQHTCINDMNGPLMGLWQRILDDPEGLSDDYEKLWNASLADPKQQFLDIRERFNRTQTPAELLYLLNRIVKGSVRYGRNGAFNQSADNRRLGARPALVRDRISRTSTVLRGTQVESGDYASLLVSADRADLVYLDPPYQGVTDVPDTRYLAGLRRPDFEEALQKAVDHSVSFIVSYDEIRADEKYGGPIDPALGLAHLHVGTGRSAQSTLNGRAEMTTESLYLSPALVARLGTRLPFLAESRM